MSDAWIVVAVVGVGDHRVQGGRAGPHRAALSFHRSVQAVVDLLAPVMLIALVVTQTFGGDEEIEVDARVVGVGAAVDRDRAARARHRGDGRSPRSSPRSFASPV